MILSLVSGKLLSLQSLEEMRETIYEKLAGLSLVKVSFLVLLLIAAVPREITNSAWQD